MEARRKINFSDHTYCIGSYVNYYAGSLFVDDTYSI